MPRILLITAIALGAVVLIVMLSLLGLLPGGTRVTPPSPASITFWGFEDDEGLWRRVIDEFNKQYRHITVTYTKFDPERYEDTLINALAEGRGPDVFTLPNSLINKHKDKMYPFPQQELGFTNRDFRTTFVDSVAEDLITPEGAILGLPIFIDTPVLFYNKDMFNAAGIAQPPTSWDETVEISRRLTVLSPTQEIIKSGLIMGAGNNMERAFEILSSLMLQNGDQLVNRQNNNTSFSERSTEALAFYTSFTDPGSGNFSWTNRMPAAFTTFAEERGAMVIGLSQDRARILAKNPHLNLGVTAFPQQKNNRTPAVYGSYFFPTVSRLSKNPIPAWQFVQYLASHDGASVYLENAMRPTVRRDLIAVGSPTAELAIPYRQSLISRTWRIPDDKNTKKIFIDAIESVASGLTKPSQAASKLFGQIQLLLQ